MADEKFQGCTLRGAHPQGWNGPAQGGVVQLHGAALARRSDAGDDKVGGHHLMDHDVGGPVLEMLAARSANNCSRSAASAIYQTHIARLEEKLTAVQNALEHSRRTLAFYEIAAKTGSEETAKDLYLARYGEENG